MMERQICFDCLRRRIQSDFSDKLVFSYGIYDSALPFGSRAVVKMSNSSGEAASEFMVVYLARHEDDCLTRYVLAGRRWGDQTFHTVMPWVIDFSVKPDEKCDLGWRDLSKSKWRLAKGDEQLDFTYSTSEIPHHVSDECLSELAVCSYKARRLPLSVLRMAVRSVYEPNEYPSTMQRLYQWTPDECIPEFYCDHQIFSSIHSGMNDLAVPPWAATPEEFIKLHRDALESDRVSREIHNWIDITFGYKMSGQAAVAAKNVMLPSSQPTTPRPIGRRQLFIQQHPVRWGKSERVDENYIQSEKPSLHDADYLRKIEQAAAFCEHARHLSPVYSEITENIVKSSFTELDLSRRGSICNSAELTNSSLCFGPSHDVGCNDLLEYLEEDENPKGYQELLFCSQQPAFSERLSPYAAEDIFSIGCIIAELYLKRPLFDPISLSTYINGGHLPGVVRELPPFVKILVEACIQRDWRRRPSAKSLLESPYFPATVRSTYLFVAPLQLLAKDGSRLGYATNFAEKGALGAMGTFAAEICATHCLPLLLNPVSDAEAERAYILIKEFLKCLKPNAVKKLVLPALQKILQAIPIPLFQATGYSHLQVSLLQESFVREVWVHIGKQTYLEKIHPLVIANLLNSPHKSSASAASVLLIGSSEELGVPIVVQQILPLLKNVVRFCIDVSSMNKPEPMQSWNSLALADCLVALDGLIAFLQQEVLVKELLEAAAATLIAVCQQIGPDLTALHALPQLKELFDELAFSQESSIRPPSPSQTYKVSKLIAEKEAPIESRMDLWESAGDSSRRSLENLDTKRLMNRESAMSKHNPTKLLMNGVGWAVPQSRGSRVGKDVVLHKRFYDLHQTSGEKNSETSKVGKREPWFWYPSPASGWDGPDFLARAGTLKDELPWKIRATVIYSVRAHHGAVRSLAVGQDECTVFTAGVGAGFKGTVQRWDLSTVDCVSGYYGHEEVVNDICILPSSERVASCDGTIHVWNSQTGKAISVIAESSADSVQSFIHSSSAVKVNTEQTSMLNSYPLSTGILTSVDGSSYTCMHFLDSVEKLVAGTGNGSLRILPPQPSVYKGHSDSILDFAVWGQDVISISKNKIGLSFLSRAADEKMVTSKFVVNGERIITFNRDMGR
ncbi:hypothetical protein Cgig2_003163 [Carnegiea gigantea]|uniref:BEACH domain-containing protein n=1 Tax=Carnegiea gigantea TaxID=171969 RepID=A0A9Q1K3F1_9CARY|nr:hypothetical protein Cgig2_003163 [Carnegiea gigantea]